MNAVFQYDQLSDFCHRTFLAIGCVPDDAALASQVLLSADLRGIDSHGIARLSGYWRLYEAGRINPRPNVKLVHETPSTATVDGDKGLGLVVAPKAMEIAIGKAGLVGSGWVSVRNSNHFGIAGYHAMMALPHDMIGWAMTNASALVTPTFSKEKMLGTNPICVAIPAGEEPAFVADFATTTAANGKLEILQRKNEAAPLGWVQDADGQPTTDANALKNGVHTGAGQMIKGFDAGVEGMSLGDKKTINIPAADAYGEWSEENVIEFPKEQVPAEMQLEVGMELMLRDNYGRPVPVKVYAVEEAVVRLDANHQLAGKELVFDIELVELNGEKGGSKIILLD